MAIDWNPKMKDFFSQFQPSTEWSEEKKGPCDSRDPLDYLEQYTYAMRAIELNKTRSALIRPNGEQIPQFWSLFQVGEKVVIKNHVFQIEYVGEDIMLIKSIGIWKPEEEK